MKKMFIHHSLSLLNQLFDSETPFTTQDLKGILLVLFSLGFIIVKLALIYIKVTNSLL